MSICLIPNPPVDWEEVIRWFVQDLQGTSLKANACRLSLAAVVYHLWWQRQVGSRLLAKGSKQSIGKNLALAYKNRQSLILGTGLVFGTAIVFLLFCYFEGLCPCFLVSLLSLCSRCFCVLLFLVRVLVRGSVPN
jgi:hypothetical protein